MHETAMQALLVFRYKTSKMIKVLVNMAPDVASCLMSSPVIYLYHGVRDVQWSEHDIARLLSVE